MTKTVILIYPQQRLLMDSLWKALNKCSMECFKITIQNQTEETTINPYLLHKDKIRMVYPSLTAGIMESHQTFFATANIAYIRNKATN